MNTIKCLLVDDEPPAVELLETYSGMIEQLEVVGTSHSAVKAFDILSESTVDLLFLDIQMPVLNGLDFIKALKAPPAVVLTTAYREYALDGYDLDIIDYLLKPIAFDRFLRAIDRYRERTTVSSAQQANVSDTIFLNVNKTHHKVRLADILFVESLKDYVRVHTKKESLVVKGNLGSFLKKLPADRFLRIHRSFVVAVSHIGSYNQSEIDIVGHKLPIGVSYRGEVVKKLRS